MARKIVVTEFISLDGVFEAPGPDGSGYKYEGWTSPYGNDEFQEFKSKELDETDILLLGRITYDGFAVAWPKMEETAGEFGKKFNAMPKYVLSDTLENPEWNNSHVIKGENAVEEIKKLKAQDGPDFAKASSGKGDITVHGSGTVARFLMENELVDQFNLLVFPVVLGEGKRLFDGAVKTDLELVESEKWSSGVVKLIYKPK